MSISGVVRCKEACSSHVKITLSSVGSLDGKATSKQELNLSSNKFSFENVLPGKYKLEVSLRWKTPFGSLLLALCLDIPFMHISSNF